MISLKAYAENNKISYEAIRKQVARYKEELGDHIIVEGRQQFLDDEAVAFLDDKRKKNPVVVQTINKDERIEELENELDSLKKKMLMREAELQTQISAAEKEAKEAYKELNEKSMLIATAEQQVLLLEEKTNVAVEAAVQKAKIEFENDKNEAIRQAEDSIKNKLQEEFNKELAAVKAELEAEKQKTWFQKLLGR